MTEYVRWSAQPSLRHPTMVAAFTGWNDAGDAGSSALRVLIESWDATPIASIDPEEFTDFATVRPHVRLTRAGGRTIVWPATAVWSASTPGGDVVLVLGPEPALRWRSFCEQLVGLAERLGVVQLVTLGALVAEVPHTRPSPVIGTSADSALRDRYDLRRSRYEGPTGIVGVLHEAMNEAGVPSASLWATVPAYVSHQASPVAAVALMSALAPLLGTPTPVGPLADQVARYLSEVDEQVGGDDDLVNFVDQLERMYDRGELGEIDSELDDDDDDDDADADDDEDDDDAAGEPIAGVRGGDGPERQRRRNSAAFSPGPDDSGELVAEVERFLREHGNG